MSHPVAKKRDDEEESETPPPPDGGWGWMVVFGSFMIHVISDIHGVSQPSVSRIVKKVSLAIANLLPQFIKYPENLLEVQQGFYEIAQFPNVVGALDCTHIRIKNPCKDEALLYMNRKGFYSLNVQVVCDANCKILDIIANWRGSAHDSRIWHECGLRDEFENGTKRGILLGDGGYPCTRYLLTPLLHPGTPQEQNYNRSHVLTRNPVERCFGQWKSMFRALQNSLQISLETAKTAISAMAVLYNIRKMRGENENYADGVTYSFGIFYDEFLGYFNEGKGLTSWILSILVGVTLCSGPISSSLVNRWGCRAVTIAGAIVASICLVTSFWAQNVMTLCVTIGIGAGLGFGLIYLPAIVSVTMYFEKKRSLATGIAVCGSGFGTFIFAPIISKLLAEYGWRGSILIIAGIVLQCILFGALFRPLESEAVPKKEEIVLLKTCEANVDIHVSDHDFPQYAPLHLNGVNQMHRPHSVAHFTLPKSYKHEMNGNIPGKIKPSDVTRLALSQPMLTQSEIHYRPHHHGRHHGPLDRPDIFYQGSLMNIPSYRSRLDLKPGEHGPAERRHSSFGHRKHHHADDSDEEDTKLCGVIPCSPETKDTLREMLDFSLFKDPTFIVFSASNLLTSIGFNIPYVYIVPKAKDLGMTVETAGMLISIIGAANTVGRIVLGYVSDKPWINRLQVYNWCLTICGIATFASAFCYTFYSLAIYSAVYGFTIGAYVGLTSVILVDLLGLERLTNAFGLLLLFQGIASLVGPPIAGSLFDITASYDPGFCLAGCAIALSGLILFLIPPLQRWQLKKMNKSPQRDSAEDI